MPNQPPGLDYRMWPDDALAKWQEMDPGARNELARRQQERARAIPQVMQPSLQVMPPPSEASRSIASTQNPIGPTQPPPGGFPPTGLERAGDFLKGMPGRIADTYSGAYDAYSSGVNELMDSAARQAGIGPGGAGAAPGSFRAAQEVPPRDRVSAGITAFKSALSDMLGRGGSPEGGPTAPVPGPKPPIPPVAAGGGGLPPVPGPNPGLPGNSGGPLQNLPGADPSAAPAPGGPQSFMDAISPENWNNLTRLGVNVMSSSGPQPGFGGLGRTPGTLEALGKGSVNTLKATDRINEVDKRLAARKAEADANREVKREANKIRREDKLAQRSFERRKLILNMESKALDRQVKASGISAANKRKVSEVRKDYDELIANAATEQEAAELKAERNEALNSLGMSPVSVRPVKDKAGKTRYVQQMPDGSWREVR